jgi:cytochrome c556
MEEDSRKALEEAINKHDAIAKQKENEFNNAIQNYQNEISALKQQHETTIASLNTEIETLKKKCADGKSKFNIHNAYHQIQKKRLKTNSKSLVEI